MDPPHMTVLDARFFLNCVSLRLYGAVRGFLWAIQQMAAAASRLRAYSARNIPVCLLIVVRFIFWILASYWGNWSGFPIRLMVPNV